MGLGFIRQQPVGTLPANADVSEMVFLIGAACINQAFRNALGATLAAPVPAKTALTIGGYNFSAQVGNALNKIQAIAGGQKAFTDAIDAAHGSFCPGGNCVGQSDICGDYIISTR